MREIDELLSIMRRLRAPDGCPWDREQTHETLKSCLIGETAEYLDAVDRKDDAAMREELGDLLMEIVLNAVIAEERGAFTFRDVTKDVSEKMIRRHPHVFAREKAENVDQVLAIWDDVKKKEKGADAFSSVLSRVPRNLPALLRAEKVQKKAAKTGFDWPDEEGVREKLREEIREVQEALDSNDPDRIAGELGDLMFTIVNLARFRGRESASDMLQLATDKFIRRFQYVERNLGGRKDASLSEMDRLWNEAKKNGL